MNTIKNYILKQVAGNKLSQDQAKQLLLELTQMSEASSKNEFNDIAIVGMAGRFPKAENVDEFWELLREGVNCIDDYPASRKQDFEHILRNPYYTEFLIGDAIAESDIDKAHARAGYLKQIDKFDADFFAIPPSEATFMDPYQRISLETAWETMEDAGYGDKTLFGSNTGVFIGKENTNYSLYRYCSVKDPMQLTGSWESIMASRISYLFNFRGPCMVIDTACSAGLVSIHMAARSILNGECEVAIAGGINLSVTGEFNQRFQGGMNMDSVESNDSVIRTFDARANGTVWGEGVAFVMLKPLKRALRDGDNIHAIIKGSAINNDGASNGLTAPNAEAQEEVIVRAWETAGIHPDSLQYIEAHGTGTVLGDPIELKGLTASFRRYTSRKQFCAIGSLKTNMGHLVSASGCASLFKVVKQMQHKLMAPTINFAEPNPYIQFQNSPLYVNDMLREWQGGDTPRRAALSSFGFSHTNCHMVVEEAPALNSDEAKRTHYCLTLSTKKLDLLRDYVQRYIKRCHHNDLNLADLCFTANTGRGHYAHRIAIVASTVDELRDNLEMAANLINQDGDGKIAGKVYFSSHLLVSDKKKQRSAGEITAAEKSELSRRAQQALSSFVGQGDENFIQALADLYSRGGDVNWKEFYSGEKRRRLSLPTYPFERVRRWADPKISKILNFSSRLHPLVDQQVKAGDNEWHYQSLFSPASHWILSDHKIRHTCVVPGTTYLEMARFCASHALGWQQLELKNVFFLQPMIVEEGQHRLLRVVLKRQDDMAQYYIESRDQNNDKDQWQRHVEGSVFALTQKAGQDLALGELKSSANTVMENYVGDADTGVFQFGPHWDCVRSAWDLPETTLAKLALPENLQSELEKFLLHPSVLDNAMNLTSQISGDTYLPFMYKRFRFFAPFTQTMYSHICPIDLSQSETNTYNVRLSDENGRLLAEIEGYVTKRVNNFQFNDEEKNSALSLRWLPAVEQSGRVPTSLWVFGDSDSAVPGVILESWRELGIEVKEFSAENVEESAKRFSKGEAPDGIVMLYRALPDATQFGSGAETASLYRLFHLAKSLQQHKVRLPFGLVIISEHSRCLNQQERSRNPYAAAASMLGVTLGQEMPDLAVRLIDSDLLDRALAEKIVSLQPGRLHLYRDHQLYSAELYPIPLAEVSATVLVDDGVYLISGGTGGLGIATAEYISSRVKANIVLCGRKSLTEQSQWSSQAKSSDKKEAELYRKLVELQGKCKSLRYVQVDVTDTSSVNDMVGGVKAAHKRINGLFHTAGIAGDGFILRKSFDTFRDVLAAKVTGTVNLLRSLDPQTLDFALLYSSITALTAGEGQGDYAAANAFMDAVASAYPNIFAINWSSWAEVGMAAAFGVDDALSPFEVLTPEVAFSRMEAVLSQPGIATVIPADINAAVLAQEVNRLPFVLAPEFANRINREAATRENLAIDVSEIDIRGKSEEELSEIETTLAKIYGAVLGLKEIDVFTNFLDMGGNSIIATHLLKVVEEYFPGQVDISDIFSYPSIDVMAEYLQQKNGVKSEAKEEETDWEAMLDNLTQGQDSVDKLMERV